MIISSTPRSAFLYQSNTVLRFSTMFSALWNCANPRAACRFDILYFSPISSTQNIICLSGLRPWLSIVLIFAAMSSLVDIIVPPSPVVNVFVPWNEKTPKSPMEPAFLPLYSEPSASAASSITGRLCFFAIFITASISTPFPSHYRPFFAPFPPHFHPLFRPFPAPRVFQRHRYPLTSAPPYH